MGVGESEGGLRFEEELSPFDGVRTGEPPLSRSGALSFRRTRSLSSIGIFLYLEEPPTVPGGESIPTILKSIVKITPILAKCNIDAGLRIILPR